MKKLALGLLAAAIATTGCSDTPKKKPLIDAPGPGGDMGPTVDMPVVAACNVLTQTGCNAGEKCTWFEDDMSDPPIGHIGCAAAGTVAIGGACMYGAPGATGFDDCVGGSVCVGGTCEAICDHQGGAPMCAANFGCVRISGLFGPAMSTEPPAAGVCEPSCDPIADNDYNARAGGAHAGADTRTGTACGSDRTQGCYGNISDSGDRTHFICAYPALSGGPMWPTATGSQNLVHRNVIPANQQYLNACHPGYTIAFAADATGSTMVDCYSYCKPGNSFGAMGSGMTPPPAVQAPNGVAPHRCRVADSGRTGNFGTAANGVTTPIWTNTEAGTIGNGEHCMYSWNFEVDDAGTIHKSATSDSIGICWDHSKYNADFDGNAATPNTALPPCSRLKLKDNVDYDATNAGCVDTITSEIPTNAQGKLVVPNVEKFLKYRMLRVPAFDPAFGGAMTFQRDLRTSR